MTKLANALLGTLLGTGQVWSHHSGSQYDFENIVWVEGIVSEADVRNPHIKLVLQVADTSGETRAIEFEGEGRNNLFRSGWRPEDIQTGHKITIGYAARRSGSDGGYIRTIRLASGKEL
jgi:hypothetical protein